MSSDISYQGNLPYFPKGSPEFNAVEECWKQEKDDFFISKY